jgi:nucleoside-diphosphate-sugar epimerase
MRTLVTGATGFIGSRLVERLIAEGGQVTILNRRNGSPPFASSLLVRACTGDILDIGSIRRAMEECDRVYHLAAFAKPWAKDPSTFMQVNVSGLRNVLHAARDAKIRRVVFTSTAMTIGPSPETLADETSPPPAFARTLYEKSKLMAEAVARQSNDAGLPVVVVNPTRVFGPGPLTEANSVTRMIQLYIEGRWRWILGTGREVGNYAFIDDVVTGHMLAMERGRPGERYLLGGANARFAEFIRTVGEISRRAHRLIHIPAPLALAFARFEATRARLFSSQPVISPEWVRTFLDDWAYSTGKAERELGYRPTPLREAMTRTIAWIEGGGSTPAVRGAPGEPQLRSRMARTGG